MLLALLNTQVFISYHTARSFRMRSMQPADRHPTGEEVHPSEIDPEQMININTAGAAELELLPGIGPSLAKEIMDHRSANGLFNTADDLLAVSGIGPAKVELIRDLITFH
jgi:competence protein ComEA